MPMTLNDVPLALVTENLANTQNKIRQNFLSINNSFEVDHQGYNLANTGKHNSSTYLERAAGVATGVTELSIYNKNSAPLPLVINDLFVRFPNSGDEINFTKYGAVLSATGGIGFSVLPSGIINKWGTFSTDGTSEKDIDVNAFPFHNSPTIPPSRIFTVQVTPVGGTHTAYLINIDNATRIVTIGTSVAGRAFTIMITAGLRT